MKELRERVGAEVGSVVVGQDAVVDPMLAALAVGGHVLLEGVPGVAKTLLANAMARALGVSFSRLQFTPDMLPSDVTGTMTLRGGALEFRPGPVFASVVLADEINRTPPKTQAALLEAMQEGQVTVDGEPHRLPDPFLVIATQNPIEYEGTYPLPEAQLDRFTMRIDIGYPTLAEEARMLTEQTVEEPLESLRPVTSVRGVIALAEDAKAIYVEESVNRYVVALLRHTRGDPRLYLGASPRSGIALLRVAKARALARGRDFVQPDDVKAVAEHVLSHRLILAPDARSAGLSGRDLVRDAVEKTPVPV
jgi:MoxR-like ATPase